MLVRILRLKKSRSYYTNICWLRDTFPPETILYMKHNITDAKLSIASWNSHCQATRNWNKNKNIIDLHYIVEDTRKLKRQNQSTTRLTEKEL